MRQSVKKKKAEKNRTTKFRVARALLGWIFRLMFFLRVANKKNEPAEDRNFIVCSNHISAFDPILIAAALRKHQPRYMAKKELFDIPVLRGVVRAFGAFPINRSGGNAGTVLHTISLLKSGKTVGMFPQGTRCPERDPRSCKVKNGVGMIAARSESDVLPVFIKTKGRRMRVFRPVKIIIGEPISFSEFNYDPTAENEYRRMSQMVFDRICTLGETDEAKK